MTIVSKYLVLLLPIQSDTFDYSVPLDPEVDGSPVHRVEHPAYLSGQETNINLEESLCLTQLDPNAVLHAKDMVFSQLGAGRVNWLLNIDIDDRR